MKTVRISDEAHKRLEEFRNKLNKISGLNFSLADTISFILRYGPEPKDYWFKKASEV
jgi:hypothetical protein